MIIIIIIFIILLIFLKLKQEHFLVNRTCHGAKKINEINIGDEFNTRISIAPYNDMPTEGAEEAKKVPKPPGESDEGNNENKYIKMKMVNVKCDDENYEFLGFDPNDLRDIDESVIETKFGEEIVNNAKVIPLLFNDLNYTIKNNFGNPDFVNKLDNDIKSYEEKINNLYEWYKNAANLTDDPDKKDSCQTNEDCTGGDHLNETEQGGYCDMNTKKCVCKKGWLGTNCSNKSFDMDSASSRF